MAGLGGAFTGLTSGIDTLVNILSANQEKAFREKEFAAKEEGDKFREDLERDRLAFDQKRADDEATYRTQELSQQALASKRATYAQLLPQMSGANLTPDQQQSIEQTGLGFMTEGRHGADLNDTGSDVNLGSPTFKLPETPGDANVPLTRVADTNPATLRAATARLAQQDRLTQERLSVQKDFNAARGDYMKAQADYLKGAMGRQTEQEHSALLRTLIDANVRMEGLQARVEEFNANPQGGNLAGMAMLMSAQNPALAAQMQNAMPQRQPVPTPGGMNLEDILRQADSLRQRLNQPRPAKPTTFGAIDWSHPPSGK